MVREEIDRIMTFDAAFDTIPGISRFRAWPGRNVTEALAFAEQLREQPNSPP